MSRRRPALPDDLRLRLLAALAAILILTPVASLPPAATALAAMALLALGQPLPWRRLLHAEGFLILLLVTLPFTLPGTPLLRLGPLSASAQGLDRALVLACKISASVLLLTLLFHGVEPARMGAALRALRLPERLVRLFLSVARYRDLLAGEFTRAQEAMRARAFTPRSNLHSWRSYGTLVGMVLLRALARAERVEEAMRLRGYSGRFPTTPLPRPKRRDLGAAALLVAGALLLLIWDHPWTA